MSRIAKGMSKKPKVKPVPEGDVEFLERSDLSELIEKGDVVKLQTRKTIEPCPRCSAKRLRKRIIDVPLFNDQIVLRKVRVIYCPNCKQNFVEIKSFQHFLNLFNRELSKIDESSLREYLEEGLRFFEQWWNSKANQRKVLTFYFPSETTGQHKNVHVSIRTTDPLAKPLGALNSSMLRDLLGIQYYEGLQQAAAKENRTISQFIKSRLSSIVQDVRSQLEKKMDYEKINKQFQQFQFRIPADTMCRTCGILVVPREGDKINVNVEYPDRDKQRVVFRYSPCGFCRGEILILVADVDEKIARLFIGTDEQLLQENWRDYIPVEVD